MSQNVIIIGVIAVIVIAVLLYANKKKGGDINIPATSQRTDLKFGFYGTVDDQVAETATYTNLNWEAFWRYEGRDLDKCVADIKASNKDTVIDVAAWLFAGAAGSRYVVDESVLRSLFDKLKAAGALPLVKYIVPSDEPNLDGNEDIAALLPQAIAQVKKVAAEYPELFGVKMGCTFTSIRLFTHLELFDVVGFDHYDAFSSIFQKGGEYDKFTKQLDLSRQKTWLFPGGYINQDPIPFLNFANSHKEVDGIVAFIYKAPPWETKMQDIRSVPAMKAAYEAVGSTIVNAR